MGDSEEATDGRALRRVRNQDAVVTAILALLDEGEAQPTAHQVSQRSGVSMRSIFRLFDDMDALHRAAIDRQIERITPMLTPLPTNGPAASRIKALVGNRREIFEAIAPVRRLALRLAPQSPPIRQELARIGRYFRDQVASVFTAELHHDADHADHDAADGDVLLEALDAATSWDTWERLRVGQGLDAARTAEVVATTLDALVRRGT